MAIKSTEYGLDKTIIYEREGGLLSRAKRVGPLRRFASNDGWDAFPCAPDLTDQVDRWLHEEIGWHAGPNQCRAWAGHTYSDELVLRQETLARRTQGASSSGIRDQVMT